MGFGGFGSVIFGTYGCSRDFNNFLSSMNTMARLSFGLYEYDDYVSDGLGHGYEGIGLGDYQASNICFSGSLSYY